MLALLADFGKKVGQQMVAVGIAGIALKKAFANPYAAIAAGTALIALSTIVGNTLKKGPSLAIGTNFVKSDGFAQIHKGEAIVPAKVVEGGFKQSGQYNKQIEVYGFQRGTDLYYTNKYAYNTANRLK
jgi:hypothetical protein